MLFNSAVFLFLFESSTNNAISWYRFKNKTQRGRILSSGPVHNDFIKYVLNIHKLSTAIAFHIQVWYYLFSCLETVTSRKSTVHLVATKCRALSIGHLRNDTDRVEPNYSEKNLSKYHSFHHKSHTDSSVRDKDVVYIYIYIYIYGEKKIFLEIYKYLISFHFFLPFLLHKFSNPQT